MNRDVEERLNLAARAAYSGVWKSEKIVSAPGRIELIGNHLDYNGGPVLAAAINRRITIAVRYNETRQISAVFADFAGQKPAASMVSVDDRVRDMASGVQPENYLIGAIQALDANGISRHTGAEMVIAGNLPFGVGISSSAALCVALTGALSQQPLDQKEHVRLAQEAENRTGSPCGAMDQSASVYGDAIRFEGKDLSVRPIAANLNGYEFILTNSNVVRTLGSSSYPVRVQETQEALRRLNQSDLGAIDVLADIKPTELIAAEQLLIDAGQVLLARRLRHIVTETERVGHAQTALDTKDWVAFGQIMNAAGKSSAHDYEISHPDVESLVDALGTLEGVHGARMMGGGEGGSVLALISDGSRAQIVAGLDQRYYRPRGGPSAADSVIACAIDHGVVIT